MYDTLGYLGTRWETLDTLGFDRIRKHTLGYARIRWDDGKRFDALDVVLASRKYI